MTTRILLPLAALAAVLSGCPLENEASIQFYAVCYPPAPDTTTGACVYSESCEAVALGTFWADVATVYQGVAPIEIRNQLPSNADESIGRVNTNIAYIQQFRLEFVLPGSGFTLPEEWVDANVTVPTSGSTVALVPVLPPSIVTVLGPLAYDHLMVNIRAVGQYADDRYFETGPFKVPVDICRGCYVSGGCATAVIACPQEGQYAAYDCLQ
jgi:hypothetical protein